jgi:hypothetical protein
VKAFCHGDQRGLPNSIHFYQLPRFQEMSSISLAILGTGDPEDAWNLREHTSQTRRYPAAHRFAQNRDKPGRNQRNEQIGPGNALSCGSSQTMFLRDTSTLQDTNKKHRLLVIVWKCLLKRSQMMFPFHKAVWHTWDRHTDRSNALPSSLKRSGVPTGVCSANKR